MKQTDLLECGEEKTRQIVCADEKVGGFAAAATLSKSGAQPW